MVVMLWLIRIANGAFKRPLVGVCAAGFKKELGDVADESMLLDSETVGSA